jgi:hypothetical protein
MNIKLNSLKITVTIGHVHLFLLLDNILETFVRSIDNAIESKVL